MAVPGLALVGDLPGGDLQRGKQRGGAVPHIVVRALLGPVEPDRADRLGAFESLNLVRLIHAQHDRGLGRMQVEADDIVDLGRQLRVVENSKVSARQGRTRYSRQMRATVS
jgi:hypothetical protein